jgi:2',3'-cyclic-nucleotide 2'-phosphodiesterase (5'-nucleotidase family)
MKFKSIYLVLTALCLFSCKPAYRIAEMKGSIVEMNDSFDATPHTQMQSLVQSYKVRLDKEMNEVIGTSEQLMDYGRPESLLTNLTSDVMKAYADEHLPDGADVAVMNVHGHRATMPKGPVTIGNLYEIYSFDNTITYLDLKGTDLKKMFDAYAHIGGAGISSNVKLVIQDRKVKSVLIDGKLIDDNRLYSIVTLDYLAEGNDHMDAFRDAKKKTNSGITLRDIMIDFVKEKTRRGESISSRLDGRITLIP